MAVANLTKLRKRAKKAGMENARTARREELEEFLSSNGKSNRPSKKNKVSKPKRKASAQSRGKSKKSPAKAKRTSSPSSNGNGGRLAIGNLKWKSYDKTLWNPREGSATDLIFKSLQKHKGDRDSVFNELKKKIDKIVPKTSNQGNKRTKAQQLARLKYVISRTVFEFAKKTGQHESGTNRIPYGTGENASQRVRGKTILKSEKKTTRKASAKKGTTKKGKKRGRPKGSKNKKK